MNELIVYINAVKCSTIHAYIWLTYYSYTVVLYCRRERCVRAAINEFGTKLLMTGTATGACMYIQCIVPV